MIITGETSFLASVNNQNSLMVVVIKFFLILTHFFGQFEIERTPGGALFRMKCIGAMNSSMINEYKNSLVIAFLMPI